MTRGGAEQSDIGPERRGFGKPLVVVGSMLILREHLLRTRK